MENHVCEKCGSDINPEWKFCGKCGNVLSQNNGHTAENEKINVVKNNYKISRISLIIAIIIFITASIFLYKAYDVKNNYYSSDTNYSLNQNSYVGGDAYNYIINSGYFSGYMSFAGALYITSAMFVILCIKNKEK